MKFLIIFYELSVSAFCNNYYNDHPVSKNEFFDYFKCVKYKIFKIFNFLTLNIVNNLVDLENVNKDFLLF